MGFLYGRAALPGGVRECEIAWDKGVLTRVDTVSSDVTAELPEGWLILPGLVDEHCHGGGGASFPDAKDSAEVAQAAGEHLAHGTTSIAAALTTLSVERMEAGAS